MCLAIPGKIVERDGDTAVIEVEGIRKQTNVAFLPKVQVGDYVIVHAGFAIQQWSQQDVDEWQAIMGEMRAVMGEQ